MPQTTWATTADVTAYTGATVTETQLAQANTVIETVCGRMYTVSATRLGARNAEWLKRAVAYQAAWLLRQPDFYGRMDVTQFAQDGRSTTLRDGGVEVAPLARRALARCSWMRSRSMHVKSPFLDGPGVNPDPRYDNDDGWP